jgi:hypothetical protein
LRSDHSEKIHIQKSRKKKQAWFLLNPFVTSVVPLRCYEHPNIYITIYIGFI